MIKKVLLFLNTLRYLKLKQIFYRIFNKIPTIIINKTPYIPSKRVVCGTWTLPSKRIQSLQENKTFLFLNEIGRLPKSSWHIPNKSKLWMYNLHYFDDLNAFNAHKRYFWHQKLILEWIKHNKPFFGIGWEPYPTSLRIVNWIKWSLAGQILTNSMQRSLILQGNWLIKNIEWHLLGNHLFANAKALVFLGVFFNDNKTEKFLKKGLKIIDKQIDEQIMGDGGHFELSPMYHSIILEDFLDLINLHYNYNNIFNDRFVKKLSKSINKMLFWLNEMCHPDKEISFFNDSATKIAPSPSEINRYAKNLGFHCQPSSPKNKYLNINHFEKSGFITMQSKNAKIFLDVGQIGADYLPGHGHADTLSFEMSLFNKRLFVNSGTSRYDNDSIRLYERGTMAHNTVAINNENSSEIWSSFRVAKRAKPFGLFIKKTNEMITVYCEHDGYKRLEGKPVHKRYWIFRNKKLIIKDEVIGCFKSAKAYFHLHPKVRILDVDKSKISLKLPGCRAKITVLIVEGELDIITNTYSHEFGKRLTSKCLELKHSLIGSSSIELIWNEFEET